MELIKTDILTGKIKKHRINFRIDDILNKAIKIYLYETHQIGCLSEILRDLIYNYIQSEKGSKFMINPLWQKQQQEILKTESLKEQLGILDTLESRLEQLSLEHSKEKLSEVEIQNPKESELITHSKYHIFIKRKHSKTWTCRICEMDNIKPQGLHFHKCWKRISN